MKCEICGRKIKGKNDIKDWCNACNRSWEAGYRAGKEDFETGIRTEFNKLMKKIRSGK